MVGTIPIHYEAPCKFPSFYYWIIVSIFIIVIMRLDQLHS
jgi:hypothetical protein